MNTLALPPAEAKLSFPRRALIWYVQLMKEVLPPTTFFFIGFNLVLWTKQMIVQEHGIEFGGFLAATVAALLVGKAVLVTDRLPFMRRFDGAPLIQPILFKTAIYWICLFLVRLGEGLVHFLREGGALTAFPQHLMESFSWPRFLTVQVWLMVLFLVYVTIHELNSLFGDGEPYRLFFRWRSARAKLTRRHRIRLLVRLSRLTEANPVEASAMRAPRRTPSWWRSSARSPRRPPSPARASWEFLANAADSSLQHCGFAAVEFRVPPRAVTWGCDGPGGRFQLTRSFAAQGSAAGQRRRWQSAEERAPVHSMT